MNGDNASCDIRVKERLSDKTELYAMLKNIDGHCYLDYKVGKYHRQARWAEIAPIAERFMAENCID